MINYFNNHIKPLNDQLTEMLGITPPKTIQVKGFSLPNSITVQVLVDSEIETCNHAGAEEEIYMDERYSHDLEDVLQDEYKLLTCDKDNCKAIYHEHDQEWSTV